MQTASIPSLCMHVADWMRACMAPSPHRLLQLVSLHACWPELRPPLEATLQSSPIDESQPTGGERSGRRAHHPLGSARLYTFASSPRLPMAPFLHWRVARKPGHVACVATLCRPPVTAVAPLARGPPTMRDSLGHRGLAIPGDPFAGRGPSDAKGKTVSSQRTAMPVALCPTHVGSRVIRRLVSCGATAVGMGGAIHPPIHPHSSHQVFAGYPGTLGRRVGLDQGR